MIESWRQTDESVDASSVCHFLFALNALSRVTLEST
jgi:hypothetical protein